jgi:hypothetical protein
MVMNWQSAALALAGAIGSCVAVFHGVLTQRLMVRPFERVSNGKLAPAIGRLVAGLLHFSTFNWFLGGLALIVVAIWCGRDMRLAVGLLVGSSYLYGALGNFWATRGRHAGWMLYAVATVLIAYGITGAGD